MLEIKDNGTNIERVEISIASSGEVKEVLHSLSVKHEQVKGIFASVQSDYQKTRGGLFSLSIGSTLVAEHLPVGVITESESKSHKDILLYIENYYGDTLKLIYTDGGQQETFEPYKIIFYLLVE